MQDPDVSILLAERAIRRCLADYCSGIDRCDEALAASAFHTDSQTEYGQFAGSGAQFVALTVKTLRKHTYATVHRMGEPRIDHSSVGLADVETPIFAQHVVDPPGVGRGPGHELMAPEHRVLECFAGWYLDRFEQREGTWRIAQRRLVHGWDTVLPLNLAFPPGTFPEGLPRK